MVGFLGRAILTGATILIKGKILNSTTGAEFIKGSQSDNFLSPSNKGLLIDGMKKRLSLKESFQNVCLTANVGMGKTTRYIIPNVLDKAKRKASMAIHDPKGEIFLATSGYLKENDYNVIVYDPSRLEYSNCYNPFSSAETEIELEQIAETLIWSGNPQDSNPYWNNGAVRILNPLIKCLSFGDPKYFNLPNLHHLIQNFGEMGESLEYWVSRNCWNPKYPNDPYVLEEWKGALTGNKEAVQSFIGICLTALRLLTNREIRQFFSQSDYNLSNLRRRKTAVFLITPPNKQKYFSFITSLFFSSIFNECMKPKHLSGKSLPVYVFYDEFGNSYISDFPSVATTIRGYGVSLSIVLQSITQLTDKYGQSTAQSILGAFTTNICFSASNVPTAEYFSKLSGIVRERQIHKSDDLTTTLKEYNLLNADEVRRMKEDEILVISKNRQAGLFKSQAFYENRFFNKVSQFPVYYNLKEKPPTIALVNLE